MEFGTSVGAQNDAGLPNITGVSSLRAQKPSINEIRPPFSIHSTQGSVASSGTITMYNLNFDASLSNSIYGNSTTVQPKSLVVSAIIKY